MPQEWPAPEVLLDPVVVSKGTVIQTVGTEVRKVHLIERGLVGRLVFHRGHEVLDRVRTVGWLLGAEPAMTTGKYGATIVALNDCVLRPISVNAFRGVLVQPGVSAWLNQMFATDEVAQAARRAGLAAGTTEARMQELLIELMQAAGARATNGSVRLTLPLTVTEIAGLVGATREHTSRILSELETRHWLIKQRGWFVVPATSPLMSRILSGRTHRDG